MENTNKERVSTYLEKIKEIETLSVDEVLSNYADMSPEFIKKDLSIKEQMANTYEYIVLKYKDLSSENKIDVYKMILLLTMGMDDLSTVKTLDGTVFDEIQVEFKKRVLPAMQSV